MVGPLPGSMSMLCHILGNTRKLERRLFLDFGLAITEISTKKYSYTPSGKEKKW